MKDIKLYAGMIYSSVTLILNGSYLNPHAALTIRQCGLVAAKALGYITSARTQRIRLSDLSSRLLSGLHTVHAEKSELRCTRRVVPWLYAQLEASVKCFATSSHVFALKKLLLFACTPGSATHKEALLVKNY